MRPHTARDLTTGSVPRHVLALAGPAILSTLVHNLYGLNDVFFAKFTGLASQTAISSNLFVLIAIFGFIQLASIGTMTLVARRTGAGNENGADWAARQGIFFGLAVSVVIAIAGQFTAPYIPRLMGMAPDVADASIRYLRIFFLGLPALFLLPTIDSVFRARGDARTPLLLQVVAVATNILGNAVAVFVLDAGVTGIATATILSRVVGSLLGLWMLQGGRIGLPLAHRGDKYFDLVLWRRLALVSWPIGARTALFGFVYQVVSGITASFGTAAQNGLGVGIRAEGLFFFVLVGFGLSAGPLVGQNLGAGHPERAERAAWTTVGFAMVPSLLFTAFFLLVPGLMMRFLTGDAETIDHGIEYLRIVSVCFVFMNLEVVLANAFVGAGDTLPPAIVDVPLTAARIPLAYLFANTFGMGPAGIWWAISGTAIARGIGMSLWFARGGWKRLRPDLDD